MNFESFNLHPGIMAGVRELGYVTPTPIQLQAIPPILQGQDLVGLAQTGTGKTAAFVLPILQRLSQGPRGCVRTLIIAPTRELAEQIHDTTQGLSKQTRLRSVTVYGGVNMTPQIQKLHGKAEIVVACPGRLLDHIRQKTINLSHIEVLVLDEADRMFDMGFLPDIRKILNHLPKHRQTLLFSATMPDDIKRLAHDILRNPITVQINHTMPLTTVSHALYPVEHHHKNTLLMKLLKHADTGSVLIFTRTKQRAMSVAQRLKKAGHIATSLQGNMSQNQRQAALDGFRKGSFKILVATDIAARGIDVSHISHVINFDMPDTVDAYTHRIGRTGRAAKTGDAFTLTTQNDNAMVRAIENTLGMKLERRKLEGFDYTSSPPRSTHAVPPQQSQRHHRRTGTGAKRTGSQMSSDSKPRYPRTGAKPFGKRRSSHAAYSSGSSARKPHSSHN